MQHNFQLKGCIRIRNDGWRRTKTRNSGGEFVADRKQGWDGWVRAASDLMIRIKITTRMMWKRKKISNLTNLKGLKLDKANYKISSTYEFGL